MQELSYQDQHNERCGFRVGVIYNGERLMAIYTDKGLRYNGEILDAAGISDWWVKTEYDSTGSVLEEKILDAAGVSDWWVKNF